MANQHKSYHESNSMQLKPLDVINGFKVRPGIYELNGATALPSGVNFTVETKEGTEVTLLLFKREKWKPLVGRKFLPLWWKAAIGTTLSPRKSR